MRLLRYAALVAAMLVAGGSARLHACPVCYGQAEGPMIDGMNMAILALLAITSGVLIAFAAFFVHLVRHARAAEHDPAEMTPGAARAGR